MAALWLLQAATGLMLVFHWELDDAAVSGPARALNPVAFGAFLERLQAARPNQIVSAVYASGGSPGRFDVLLASQGGKTDVIRVDGEGAMLRERPGNYDYSHIGIFQIATYLHQTLFLHQWGTWFIGLSGLLLATNLILGLKLAWPKIGYWSRALVPAPIGPPAARVYAWHRAVGLWLAVPALVLVCSGVLQAYEHPLESWFDDARPPPEQAVAASEPVAPNVSAASAMTTALRMYPGATLASLELPAADRPWFAIRVTRIGDVRRASGRTAVYVSSRSGRVLANYDSSKSPLKTRFWDALYAVHTGEIGGIPGRALSMLLGAWLLTMIGLGLTLWSRRRAHRSRASVPASRRGSAAGPLEAKQTGLGG